MKEKLYTIPMMDALRAEDECPFCYIERNLEQHALDFVIGPEATYMQDDVRAETDKIGFCREHLHKMFTYGNPLASALILDTHLHALSKEMKREMKNYSGVGKKGLIGSFRKSTDETSNSNSLSRWIREDEKSCYVCNHIKNNYGRYVATFLVLFKRQDTDFMELVKKGKGFCLSHLADLLDVAPQYLNEKEQKQLRDIIFPQMEASMERLIEELDWFEKKFDYRYRDAEWKTSRDVVQRAMQKIGGGYPADEPYRQK